jgi:hypothetical protein
MVGVAINQVYMDDKNEVSEAGKGMLHIQPKTLHPGYRVFRFATMAYRSDWVTKGWWIGFSPFWAIEQLARPKEASISSVARAALAISIDPRGPHFNQMDVLLTARINRTLAAWTGTPRTISTKKDGGYVERWEPDPTITQLYIPGLNKIPPGALTLEQHRPIRGNRWTPS